MQLDQPVFSLIEKENERQLRGMELIASENYVSDNVLRAAGSILTNKYAEGYPGNRYYGGCAVVDEIENIALERVKKIYACAYANVQPHSGSQANAALLGAVLNPGDTLLGLDLSMGGHLTHGASVSFSGTVYKAYGYVVDKETEYVDYDNVEAMAKKHQPKIIICGGSSYTRDWNYKILRDIADKYGALLWMDMAHTAGLIAKGLLNDPFAYCHFVTSTTHKTLRGPRGGLILMKEDLEHPFGRKDKKGKPKMMSDLINASVFPGQQGGPLMHIIAAKAVAFAEVDTPKFLTYAENVIKNAQALSRHFTDKGYRLVSGGTDNHIVLLDLRNKGITGKEAEQILSKADITINKNMLPYDERSPFTTSGIRIGSPAVTTRGLKEKDMALIVHYIDEAFQHKEDDNYLKSLAKKVNEMMKVFPLFQ